MPKITSLPFLEALVEAGVVSNTNTITRVVIDAKVGEPLRVHVEHIGDKSLLDTVPELREAMVRP
jgi:hypothetical protein